MGLLKTIKCLVECMVVAICAACIVGVSLIGIAAYATPLSASSDKALLGKQTGQATEKTETVRASMDADGVAKEVKVLATLKNASHGMYLEDMAPLTALKGDNGEQFAADGDRVVWVADGKDVSYQGTTSDELPVAMHVSYELDGRSVTASQIAGATGSVRLSYEFENKALSTCTINGSPEEMHTPFIVVTAFMVDSSVLDDVAVENARIIEDGDSMIVVGFAIPGLGEDMESVADGLDIPSGFTLTAHAEGFEISSSLTMVMSGLLDDIDSDMFDFAGLADSASALRSAFSNALNGSYEFAEGLDDLAEGLAEMSSKTDMLPSGTSSLASGAAKLTEGLRTLLGAKSDEDGSLYALRNGSARLSDGLAKVNNDLGDLIDALEDLMGLAEGIGDGELDGLGEAYAAIASARDRIAGLASSLSDAESSIDTISGSAAGISEALEGSSLPAAYENLESALSDAQSASEALSGMDLSGVSEARAYLEKALEKTKQDDPAYKDVSNAIAALDAIDDAAIEQASDSIARAMESARNALEQLAGANDSLERTAAAVDLAERTFESAKQELRAAGNGTAEYIKSALDDARDAIERARAAYNALKEDIRALADDDSEKNPLETIRTAAEKLAGATVAITEGLDGVATVLDSSIIPGAEQLEKGIEQLDASMPALSEGTHALSDGANAAARASHELAEGLSRFDSEGLGALENGMNEKISSLRDRIDALSELSRSYDTFIGKTSGTKGSVRFVYEVAAIEADE